MTTMDLSKERALHTAARYAAQLVATGGVADDVIDVTPMLQGWTRRAYALDDTVVWEGQPYTCIQAHDATQQPDWTPDRYTAGWKNWRATTPERALPFVRPFGAGYEYLPGECMRWKPDVGAPEKVYRCLIKTTYTPAEASTAWEEVTV